MVSSANNTNNSDILSPMPSSASPALRQPSAHHHHHHHHHKSKHSKKATTHLSVTLPDGTHVDKYQKKRALPDGSVLTKTRAESIPAPADGDANVNDSIGESDRPRIARIIETKTTRINPDGVSFSTTTTESFTVPSKSNTSDDEREQEDTETKVLPDGTRVITTTQRHKLENGGVNTITTRVHIAPMASPPIDVIPTNTPVTPSENFQTAASPDNITDDHPTAEPQYISKTLAAFHADDDSPRPPSYAQQHTIASSRKTQGSGYNPEMIYSQDEPIPMISRGVGAHAVLFDVSKPKTAKEEKENARSHKKSRVVPHFEKKSESLDDRMPNELYDGKPISSKNFYDDKSISTKDTYNDDKTISTKDMYDDKSTKDHSTIDILADEYEDSIDVHRPGYTKGGLAVATPVSNALGEGEEPIYAAIEYDPDAKPPLYKNRRCRVYTALALLIIAVIVSVAVIYATKPSQKEVVVVEEVTLEPTESPTLPPTTYRDVSGIKELIEDGVLQRDATFDGMDKLVDPRYLALDWILHKDEMQLELTDANLFQRYILALLAYSFDSEAWNACGSYAIDPNEETVEVVDTCSEGNGTVEEYSRWLSSIDECDWYGVSCTNGKVRGLELTENNLIGAIPPEVGQLQFLQVLALNENCVYGSLPPEIGNMSNLQQLNLEYNGMSGFVPDELFEVSSLVQLNLGWQYANDWNCTASDGSVVSTSYAQGNPENGENLGLEGEILGAKIGHLKYLKEITVNDNYFSGGIASEIGNLKQLGEYQSCAELVAFVYHVLTSSFCPAILNAGSNSFSGTIPDEISNLRSLREMWLEFNYFSGPLPDDIGHAEALGTTAVVSSDQSKQDWHLRVLTPYPLQSFYRRETFSVHDGYERGDTRLALQPIQVGSTIPSI
eukprot:scaffold4733_cov170-Alexandrium_tamarense.AAC.63